MYKTNTTLLHIMHDIITVQFHNYVRMYIFAHFCSSNIGNSWHPFNTVRTHMLVRQYKLHMYVLWRLVWCWARGGWDPECHTPCHCSLDTRLLCREHQTFRSTYSGEGEGGWKGGGRRRVDGRRGREGEEGWKGGGGEEGREKSKGKEERNSGCYTGTACTVCSK